MLKQGEADEEKGHANEIEEYLLKRGHTVKLSTMNVEEVKFEKPQDVFEKAY